MAFLVQNNDSKKGDFESQFACHFSGWFGFLCPYLSLVIEILTPMQFVLQSPTLTFCRNHSPDAIAACCGAPNKRTEYALKVAGLAPPRIIMDVRPEVGDVCERNPVTGRKDQVFYEIYESMKTKDLRALPILDEDGKFVGLLTLLDLLKVVFEGDSDPLKSRQVVSSVTKICDVIKGQILHTVDSESTDEMIVMVGAMSAEGFTKRLHQYPAEHLLVVSGDRPTIQLPALEHGVRVLVVTGGFNLSPGCCNWQNSTT